MDIFEGKGKKKKGEEMETNHKVQKVLEELLVRSHELFLGVLEGLCHELLDLH